MIPPQVKFLGLFGFFFFGHTIFGILVAQSAEKVWSPKQWTIPCLLLDTIPF